MTTRYERRGDVAVLQIDNPPVNGLGHATRKTLAEGLERALDDGAVKVVVITGTDRVFSGGADIREFNTPAALAEPNLLQLIDQVERSPKPVIAAINGVCMGGGLELALGCSYRIATPDASMGLPEVKIGLLPGAGGTQRLPRAVGKSKAMDMVLTGRMMDADEAERSGLVSRVVPGDQLIDEALNAAAKIADFSLPAIIMAKEAVNRSYETTLSEGLRFERRLFHSMFALEDQKEGMAAFAEKRAAVFCNR